MYAAETHLHAGFLSAARQLSVDHGARILASAAGRRESPHTGLGEGDEVDLGGLCLRALATPGHTPEHLSYLLLDGAQEVGVFTGGSLIVGSAARTDLAGDERTEELARAQYRSLHRLTTLSDATAVWPTHGAGSFCSAPPGAARTSTIGTEKPPAHCSPHPTRTPSHSTSHRCAGCSPTGRSSWTCGPWPTTPPATCPGRCLFSYAPSTATWLGWLLTPDVLIVILRNPDQDPDEILWPALNIGYTTIAGEMSGVTVWAADGGQLATTRLVSPSDVDTLVVDVRQANEHAGGHLPGAHLIELGSLTQQTGDLPDAATTVMCGHGERAATAASLLKRAGHHQLSILDGGPDDWVTATGRALDTGR